MSTNRERGLDHPLAETPEESGVGFDRLVDSLRPHANGLKFVAPALATEFQWRLDVVESQGVTVARAKYSADWTYAFENQNEGLSIAILASGVADMTIGKQTVSRTPSFAGIYAERSLKRNVVRNAEGGYAGGMIRFDASLVAKVLAGMFDGRSLSKLELLPILDLATEVGQGVEFLAHALAAGLHGEQVLIRSPKALPMLAEAALRYILENVPHRLSDKLERDTQEGMPRSIKRAIDYMRAHLHLPLTLGDVATEIGVSERALQHGFRKHRDISPAAYLRRIRLDAVHAELSLPENELPVQEVALKWGFTHMGRFAAQYRSAFGIYPSQTVRRAILNR